MSTQQTRTTLMGSLPASSAQAEIVAILNNLSIPGTSALTATTTELNLLSGLTATAAEINSVAKLSTRIVSLTGNTSITAALHSDKILMMNGASGNTWTFTLPAATGTGARFHFKVGVVNTTANVIATAASEYFAGNIIINSSSDSVQTEPWISLYATHNIKISLNGTTKGGVSIGDWIEVVDIAAATWAVTGIITASGTEATPFSTS